MVIVKPQWAELTPATQKKFLLSLVFYKDMYIQVFCISRITPWVIHWVWWPIKIFPLCWANHLVLNKLGKNSSKVIATAWLHFSLYDKCIVCNMWNYCWELPQKRKNTADCLVCSLHSAECMIWRVRACAVAGADLIKGENSLKNVWIFLMFVCESTGKNLVMPGTW